MSRHIGKAMYVEKPKWPIIWNRERRIVYLGTPLLLSSLQNSFLYRRFISIFVLQNYQVPYLDQWTDIEGEHSSCLGGVTTALHNASLRLPVIGDVKVKFPFNSVSGINCINYFFVSCCKSTFWNGCRENVRKLQTCLPQLLYCWNHYHLALEISCQR